MKKSLILTLVGCFAVFCLTTAFDNTNTTKEQQMQKIADMLDERLDAYRIAKEQECKDRAIAAAVVRADEEMAAAKSSKKRTVRKKPTYTTKGSDNTTTTTPPPPPPAPTRTTPPSTVPKDVTKTVEKAATNTGKKTQSAVKKAQEAQKAIEKKGRNTGKKRSGGK